MQITGKIAKDVGLPLNAAERSWARAVADGATMLAALAQAALSAKVPIADSSATIQAGVEGLAQMSDAGVAYASLHTRLSELARGAGLEPSMFGETVAPQMALAGQGVASFSDVREAA